MIYVGHPKESGGQLAGQTHDESETEGGSVSALTSVEFYTVMGKPEEGK